jgi:hypothetical protein
MDNGRRTADRNHRKGIPMATFKALPRGAQLVLVAGPLLIISLLFTWQQVEVDYGPAGVAKMPLDGWDAWGLLLALLALTVVVLVALVHLSDVDRGESVPWRNAILALGIAVLAVAALKNLTDAGSTPASYAFVGLAALVAVGAYLDWATARRADRPALARKRRGFSSAA